jgi:acyl-CoA thioesterase YciA
MNDGRYIAIRIVMLPKDTNQMGTIFGGVIMSHIDLAGSVEARKHSRKRFVTAAMENVEFVSPVFLGDTVTFYTETRRVGRTSVTVEVEVEAERTGPHGHLETVKVTAARVVYVAVDGTGVPTPIEGD